MSKRHAVNAAITCLVFLVACSTTSIVQKNVAVYPGSKTYERDLRDIEATVGQLASTVVIAGDTIPDEVRRLPGATVGEERTLTIENVVIKRIDKVSTQLVSKQESSVTVTVPTRQLKSISVNGVRRVSRSAWLWLWMLAPLALIFGVGLFARDLGSNSQDGCLNGMLIGLGLIGAVIIFFKLASSVGIFSRVQITEAVDAVWWFAQ
ncbi:MAG: hypothetical protein FGM32_02900 [Candidatus Kapabacteria bacterium]|nr:hypothetical protein [Candidatus Kapabacteria bacterium]